MPTSLIYQAFAHVSKSDGKKPTLIQTAVKYIVLGPNEIFLRPNDRPDADMRRRDRYALFEAMETHVRSPYISVLGRK